MNKIEKCAASADSVFGSESRSEPTYTWICIRIRILNADPVNLKF
jgi:hypothetical protein